MDSIQKVVNYVQQSVNSDHLLESNTTPDQLEDCHTSNETNLKPGEMLTTENNYLTLTEVSCPCNFFQIHLNPYPGSIIHNPSP